MGKFTLRIARNSLFQFLISYKLLFVLITACILPFTTIYHLRMVMGWKDLTILDGLQYEFGLYTSHYLILTPLCLFIVYDLVRPSLMDNFIFSRIRSRKHLFIGKLASCFLASLTMVVILLISACCIFPFNCRMVLKWGESFISEQYQQEVLLSNALIAYPPVTVFLYQSLMILFSFTATNWMLLLLMGVVKKKSLAMVFAVILDFGVLLFAKSSNSTFFLSPYANTFVVGVNPAKDGVWAFLRPIVYWVILLFLLFILNGIVFSKKDFLYEDAPEEES